MIKKVLVLTRKTNESIIINENIVIKIFDIRDNSVKIGIEAPRTIRVYRKEVFDAIQKENIKAASKAKSGVKAKEILGDISGRKKESEGR